MQYEDAVGVELNANLEGLNKDVEELFSKSNTLKMTMNGPDSEAYKVQGSTAIRYIVIVTHHWLFLSFLVTKFDKHVFEHASALWSEILFIHNT